jgi:hypothetical protein
VEQSQGGAVVSSEPKRYEPSTQCVEPSYQAQMIEPIVREVAWGNYVRYEDYARLKAEVERFKFTLEEERQIAREDWAGLRHENARLKAEVERLTVEADWKTPARKIKSLEAKVEALEAACVRLTKAGDVICRMAGNNEVINRHWKAAKEGGQS